jgi:hypothetical protein
MIIAKTPDGLLIVLQPDNLARMKQGDPATIPNLGITICFEDLSDEKLREKLQSPDGMKYLKRGWQNHPDDFREPTVFAKVPR